VKELKIFIISSLIIILLLISGIILYNHKSVELPGNKGNNSYSPILLGDMNTTKNSFLYNIIREIIARLDITNSSLINQVASYINNNPDNTTTVQGFYLHKHNDYGISFLYIVNATSYYYLLNSISFTNHGIFKIKKLKIPIVKFGTITKNTAGYEWYNGSSSLMIVQMNTYTYSFSQPPQTPVGGYTETGAGLWLGISGVYNNVSYLIQTGYSWDNITKQNRLFYEIYPSTPAYYFIMNGQIATIPNQHYLFLEIFPSVYSNGAQTWYFEIIDENTT
jgi:hypothetical protein